MAINWLKYWMASSSILFSQDSRASDSSRSPSSEGFHQTHELLLGGRQFAVLDQVARVGDAQSLVAGVFLCLPAQIFEGVFGIAAGHHGLGASQDGVAVRRGDVQGFVEIIDGLTVVAVHCLQRGLGEPEFVVVAGLGVLGEFLQHAVAGFDIGAAGGLQQEFKVDGAIEAHQQVDLLHGFVHLAEAEQLGGGQFPGCGIFRFDFDPQYGGVERGLVGAQVASDIGSALDHLRIAGFMGLLQVFAQGDIGTVALAGKFRQQQFVQGFFLEGTGGRRWSGRSFGNGGGFGRCGIGGFEAGASLYGKQGDDR
ncbi:MAG: hypothetical protein HPY82_12650 [Gammaproteobacteria bacterium]|nr:hypothetical protein [Gammaproteobacteria bacterium]